VRRRISGVDRLLVGIILLDDFCFDFNGKKKEMHIRLPKGRTHQPVECVIPLNSLSHTSRPSRFFDADIIYVFFILLL